MYLLGNKKSLITGSICLMMLASLGCKNEPASKAKSEVTNTKTDSKTLDSKTDTNTTTKKTDTAPGASAATLTGEHFGVFNLLHNRPMSHRIEVVNGKKVLAIDASAVDFVRYINGNYPSDWKSNVKVKSERVSALKSGRKAQMWFPSVADLSENQAIQLKVYNPAKGINTLKLKLNGKALPPQALQPGWHTIVIPVSAGIAAYENSLQIEFTDMGRFDGKLSGGAISWLRFGSAKALGASTAKAPTNVPTAQDALTLGAGQGASWYVWADPAAKLVLDVEGCKAQVDLVVQKGAGLKKVSSQTFNPGKHVYLSLSGVGSTGQVARIDIAADASCKSLKIGSAQIMVSGTMPTRPTFKKPKYVVFWMIDTLRADYLPFYNKKTNVKTPALSELAKNGAQFNVAYVQGNESKVSHASLFSALYPSRHRVLGKGKLKPHHEIMPEAIKKAGYSTGAHISNGYISEKWGFVQGWDHYVNNLRENWRFDGKSMAKHGIAWAKKNKSKPFFLYLGTIDPHVTYRAHEGIIETYDEKSYNGKYKRYLSGTALGKIKGGKLKVSARDKKRIINLYKNEITFNDQAFATLRDALKTEGMWKDTMVVVTADHGDEFWEHGGVGHGHNVHQELVHVPLLIHYPAGFKSTKIEAGVDVLDVYPTIMDILGKQRPKNLQGKSLLPLMYGAHGGYPQPAIATRYLGHYAMQARQWKLYLRKGDYAIFDRNADPKELKNAKANNPLAARWLLDGMGWFRAYRSKWDKTTFGVALNVSGSFLKEIKKPTPKP